MNRTESQHNESPAVAMENLVAGYFSANPMKKKQMGNDRFVGTPELEFRFEGIGGAPLTRADFDSVLAHLTSAGFTTTDPEGKQILRIYPEYEKLTDSNVEKQISNVRAEINGTHLIQEYCRTNNLMHMLTKAPAGAVTFLQKTAAHQTQGTPFQPVYNPEFRFKVNYKLERTYASNNDFVRRIPWDDTKKVYRLINRITYTHPHYPVHVDLSILRCNAKTQKGKMIPAYTVHEARLLEGELEYEIEVEIDNERALSNNFQHLMFYVRQVIRMVLSGIQGSIYPIPESKMRAVMDLYNELLAKNAQALERQNILLDYQPCSFIGPSSITLQIEHLVANADKSSKVPNVREHYAVTDKADGERKLMLVDGNGEIYFIDMNMRVHFSGFKLQPNAHAPFHFKNSLFDGEYISHNKHGAPEPTFMVFDCYFCDFGFVWSLPFLLPDAPANETEPPKCRYRFLQLLQDAATPLVWASNGEPSPNCQRLSVRAKTFYFPNDQHDIFACCKRVLEANVFRSYQTDGIVFAPMQLAVGGGPDKPFGPLMKTTWTHSLKWKPPQFNTIDFLVRVVKDKTTGQDKISNAFAAGVHVADAAGELPRFKTLVLHCGFDERRHGFMDPFENLLQKKYDSRSDAVDDDGFVQPRMTYSARPFRPTNPADNMACFCNIRLETNPKTGALAMRTLEGEYFEENSVVEFAYSTDADLPASQRWRPLRLRSDKSKQKSWLCISPTHANSKYKPQKTRQSFGNDFTTANNNWYSIHHPVTEEMICSGTGIPDTSTVDEEVYYSRRTAVTSTAALRDFHNLFVKSKLVRFAANWRRPQTKKLTLIDFAVGKAGDLPKWRAANIGFVLGIDIARDNIFNPIDGACARFLTEAQRHPSSELNALFLHGDCTKSVRALDERFKANNSFQDSKSRMLAKAVFGVGAQNEHDLGKMAYDNYGVGRDGFDIASCQFAIHYFFKNPRTLHQFLRNVAECTKLNGLFIGTCWDGQTVYELLEHKPMNESLVFQKEGQKMLEIIKRYDCTDFKDTVSSLGYAVEVLQESIGKPVVEYLVNFEFLKQQMRAYGFELLRIDSHSSALPSGSEMFDKLFDKMQMEVAHGAPFSYKKAGEMSVEERQISNLNRYFVFQKTQTHDNEYFDRILESMEDIQEQGDDSCAFAADIVDDDINGQVTSSLHNKRTSQFVDNPTDQTPAKKPMWKRIEHVDPVVIGANVDIVPATFSTVSSGDNNRHHHNNNQLPNPPLLINSLGDTTLQIYLKRIRDETPEVDKSKEGYLVVFNALSDEPADYTRAVQEVEILSTRFKSRDKEGGVIPSFMDQFHNPKSGLRQAILGSRDPHEDKWKLANTFGYRMATTFMPMYAKSIYEYFRAKRVLDPCAGWGDRMLAAMLTPNVELYVGFDPNARLVPGYTRMQQDVGNETVETDETKSKIAFGSRKGEGGTHTERAVIYSIPFETSNRVLNGYPAFDFAFTSPPYFDFEQYSDKNPKYKNWFKEFYEPMFKLVEQHLVPNACFAVHIGDTYAGKIETFLHEEVPKFTKFQMYGKIGLEGGRSGKIRDVFVFKKPSA